jgi:hypothetical protein
LLPLLDEIQPRESKHCLSYLFSNAKAQGKLSTQQIHFVHPPLGPGARAICILRSHPAYEYDEVIRCSLHNANLDYLPQYNALSYVWGDANHTLPIIVDGIQWQVTVDCYSALLRLREIGEIPVD